MLKQKQCIYKLCKAITVKKVITQYRALLAILYHQRECFIKCRKNRWASCEFCAWKFRKQDTEMWTSPKELLPSLLLSGELWTRLGVREFLISEGKRKREAFLLGKSWDWKERPSRKPLDDPVADVYKHPNLHVWDLVKHSYDMVLCLPILPNVYFVAVVHMLSSILNELLQGRVHSSLWEPKEDKYLIHSNKTFIVL